VENLFIGLVKGAVRLSRNHLNVKNSVKDVDVKVIVMQVNLESKQFIQEDYLLNGFKKK